MKRLLTMFLMIGVLGVYGQSTEGEMQIEANTTQQADTIIQVDTIGIKNLQIEGDTASLIKDSLLTEEIKKDQQEIMEKKVSPLSCCCLGGKKEQRKSNVSIGYTLGIYPRLLALIYGGKEFGPATDFIYPYGNWICLFHGIEISHNLNLIKSFPLKIGYGYEYSNSFDRVRELYFERDSTYYISYYQKLNLFEFNSLYVFISKELNLYYFAVRNGFTFIEQRVNPYPFDREDDGTYLIVNRYFYQTGVSAGFKLSFIDDRLALYLGLDYKMYFQYKSSTNYPDIIYKVEEINPKMLNHTIKILYNF
ncbi:MAG: hypothetical protein PHW02_05290 [bacterium]|nr:hypothetical protein [bacterium]